jgi:hypothetical protein
MARAERLAQTAVRAQARLDAPLAQTRKRQETLASQARAIQSQQRKLAEAQARTRHQRWGTMLDALGFAALDDPTLYEALRFAYAVVVGQGNDVDGTPHVLQLVGDDGRPLMRHPFSGDGDDDAC